MQIHKNDKSVTKTIDTVAECVVKYMIQLGKTLCTAESCTGGMLSQMVTSVPGASNIFLGGVCTYTEEIKQRILGVKKETLTEYTVYSKQVASEMSKGAKKVFGADVAVGITGIAGPGSIDGKPAGTVYISVRDDDDEIVRELKVHELVHDPDRAAVREVSARAALEMVMELCTRSKG